MAAGASYFYAAVIWAGTRDLGKLLMALGDHWVDAVGYALAAWGSFEFLDKSSWNARAFFALLYVFIAGGAAQVVHAAALETVVFAVIAAIIGWIAAGEPTASGGPFSPRSIDRVFVLLVLLPLVAALIGLLVDREFVRAAGVVAAMAVTIAIWWKRIPGLLPGHTPSP